MLRRVRAVSTGQGLDDAASRGERGEGQDAQGDEETKGQERLSAHVQKRAVQQRDSLTDSLHSFLSHSLKSVAALWRQLPTDRVCQAGRALPAAP